MEIEPILKEFRAGVEVLYKERLKSIILYGSWARDEATEDSDIDLVVVLAGKVDPCEEIDRMADIFTDLNLEHNVLMAVYPVSESAFDKVDSPLFINVRKEGITV
jgi:predicted nucleotidyltransferase